MKRFRVMAAALCAVVLLCGFSVPAYAYADGGEGADPPRSPPLSPARAFPKRATL